MKRLVGFLLVASLALYSTPLKADSYDNSSKMYIDNEADLSDEGCSVSGDTTTESSNDQNLYVEQNTLDEKCIHEQKPSDDQNVYTDNGNYMDQETLVTPANSEQENYVQSKRWRNILLAVAAVAVAITAMLLVHSHQGHKNH